MIKYNIIIDITERENEANRIFTARGNIFAAFKDKPKERYMNKHYKEDISIDDISAAANMNKHYFCRQFKRTTGATALGYLHNIRLTRVHNLLLNTTMPLDEIAWETGFGTTATLARVFKAAYGVPPREFRKSSRESR